MLKDTRFLRVLVALLMLSTGCFWDVGAEEWASSSLAPTERQLVRLSGTASGGILQLCLCRPEEFVWKTVETNEGDAAEAILAQMSGPGSVLLDEHQMSTVPWMTTLETKNFSFQDLEPPDPPGLVVLDEVPFFAGTETGLGIPAAPSSLTLHLDRKADKIRVLWENQGGYDFVWVTKQLKRSFATAPSGHAVLDIPSSAWFSVSVVGVQDYVPSGIGAMAMDVDGRQYEAIAFPFSRGVAPNWTAWRALDAGDKLSLGQGEKLSLQNPEEAMRRSMEAHGPVIIPPDFKFYYQSIKSRGNATGGTYRKFLGLEPGVTYRVVTRMNTLDMDQIDGDWRFSFHALAHPYATKLTPEQMAGDALLPNGVGGPNAALVGAFGPANPTYGSYRTVTTERPEGPGMPCDITLGPEDDTITVWFRYAAENEGSGVGTDWISLEKIDPQVQAADLEAVEVDPELRTEFERLYGEWRRDGAKSAYQGMVLLGARALPLLMDKMKFGDTHDADLWGAVSRVTGKIMTVEEARKITKWKFTPDEERRGRAGWAGDRIYEDEKAEVYVAWWDAGCPINLARLKRLYYEGTETAWREEVHVAGIAAIPFLLERFQAGDKTVVPELTKLTRLDFSLLQRSDFPDQVQPAFVAHAFPAGATPEEAAAWWEREKEFFTLPRVTCVDDEAPAGTGDQARATSGEDAPAQ